jgi:hypothetical protein
MVTAQDMRDKLISVDRLKEILGATEPATALPVNAEEDGPPIEFQVNPGWADGLDSKRMLAPIDATAKVGGRDVRLSGDALLTAASAIGMPRSFATKTPASIVGEALNWHYSRLTKRYTLITARDTAIAFSKGNVVPFSNVNLLDAMTAGIKQAGYNGEILTDYKYRHDVRRTRFRLVLPDRVHNVRGDDTWSYGLEGSNSLVNEIPTAQRAYAFRWVCTNGQTTTHGAGQWARRTMGQDPAQVYEWARRSVDEALRGLDSEFERLDMLADTVLTPEEVGHTIQDIMETYNVPKPARQGILQAVLNNDDNTLYGIHAAVTEAANATDTLSADQVDTLLSIGGVLTGELANRCGSCHRIVL